MIHYIPSVYYDFPIYVTIFWDNKNMFHDRVQPFSPLPYQSYGRIFATNADCSM